MAIVEIDSKLSRKDASGNTTVIYPITKATNIKAGDDNGTFAIASGGTGATDAESARINLGAAPAITYGTDAITPGAISDRAEGAVHFVYVAKDGIWDHVKSVFVTSNGVWKCVWDIVYPIRTNLTDVTAATSNPTTIHDGCSAQLEFTTSAGFSLPDVVKVDGADYEWDKSTGKLILSEPKSASGNVTVTVAAEKTKYYITTDLTGVVGEDDNAEYILYEETTILKFVAETGYNLPDVVRVTGVSSSTWNKTTGELTLNNPTGNIKIEVVGETKSYYEIYVESYYAYQSDSNPVKIYEGETVKLYFTAIEDYEFTDSLSVLNADYNWDPTSGLLELFNAIGHPQIVVTCIKKNSYIYFKSDSTEEFTLAATNVEWDGVLYYSTNRSDWKEWDGSEIRACNYRLYLRGSRNTTFYDQQGAKFVLSAEAGCYGNVNTLLEYDTPPIELTTENCYKNMFYGCTNLIAAPELPATTLSSHCYYQMFYSCTNLKAAPELPATKLAMSCYESMFNSCTNLVVAPTISAGEMEPYSCRSMFGECLLLKTPPALIATTLATRCYESMFYGCENLIAAPSLSVDVVPLGCYLNMFKGCEKLIVPPELPATELSSYCYAGMFSGCISLENAPKLDAMNLAEYCYQNMFSGCSSLKTAPELSALTLATGCYYGMFYNCTGLSKPVALPATTLSSYCYYQMFMGCSGINLSNTKSVTYKTAYAIPSLYLESDSNTAEYAENSMTDMFTGTGGEFTGKPDVNTIYYGAWTEDEDE